MQIKFSSNGWDDYLFWQKTDRSILKRINQLVKGVERDPFGGIGKPEPLKHQLSGLWSRRIDLQNRLVYSFYDAIYILHNAGITINDAGINIKKVSHNINKIGSWRGNCSTNQVDLKWL